MVSLAVPLRVVCGVGLVGCGAWFLALQLIPFCRLVGGGCFALFCVGGYGGGGVL